MVNQQWEGKGSDQIIEKISYELVRLGVKENVGDILKTLGRWKVSHSLELEFVDNSDLRKLTEELNRPAVLNSFLYTFLQIMGVQLHSINATLMERVVPKPISESLVKELGDIVDEV